MSNGKKSAPTLGYHKPFFCKSCRQAALLRKSPDGRGSPFPGQTYPPEEALGRNCRFLQGPETDPKAIDAIRAALAAQTTFTIDLINYRKSGEPFINRLRIRPLFDDSGELLYFVGAQNPV